MSSNSNHITHRSSLEMPIRAHELLVANAALWREWLAREGHTSTETWLVVAKKGIESPTSITYAEALDEALCFGWIDSGGGKRDDTTRHIRFTPRKTRSMWSARNVGYVTRLEREGRMQEGGRAAVERAKASGLWSAAYSAQAPADLLAAVAKVPLAQVRWDALPKKDRYAFYVRLGSLPISSAAREKRIQAFIDELQRDSTTPLKEPTPEKPAKNKGLQRVDGEDTGQSYSLRQTRSSSRIS